MNKLFINAIKTRPIINNVKMIVFDMAGTTITDHGIRYNTLYNTLRNFNLDVDKNDIPHWYGMNTYNVLNEYFNNQCYDIDLVRLEKHRNKLYADFNKNITQTYIESESLSLINNKLPDKFETLRTNDIKITLNTSYTKDIKDTIIDKLEMKRFIDGSISISDVPYSRPYPYMIYRLMEQHKIISPLNVIKVGDTRTDIYEGNNANCIASIGVLSGYGNIDCFINSTHIIDNVMSIQAGD